MSEKQNTLLFIILGCAALIAAGVSAVGYWGWSLFTDQAREAFNQNQVIVHHVGEVQMIHVDLMATGDEESEDVFVFRVQGTKGTGVVTAEFVTVDEETEGILSGTLTLPSGETIDLTE